MNECGKQEYLPLAQQPDDEVGSEALEQQLGDEVQVGDKGGLQDDGHVAGVEQLDGVGALRTPPLLALHRQIHSETLYGPIFKTMYDTKFPREWFVLCGTRVMGMNGSERVGGLCVSALLAYPPKSPA